MPQWLTRWESLPCAYPKWPASNRNAGRLRFGTMAGFKSEWGPTSSRYRGRLRVGMPEASNWSCVTDRHPNLARDQFEAGLNEDA